MREGDWAGNFAAGKWNDLILASIKCSTDAAVVSRRHRRRGCPNTMEMRAARALKLIQVGELSAGGHASEGADLAEGNSATLTELRQRLAIPHDPIPPMPVDVPHVQFGGEGVLPQRSLCTQAAGGPSDMTNHHLRPLSDSTSDTHSLFRVAELVARGDMPPLAVETIKLGRMTALRKESGGVRSIVSGEIMRRLVAQTFAQQVGPAVKAATAPFQYALSTRAGSECIAHVLQAVSEMDPDATVTSVDGISAYDSISRRAMLLGLQRVDGGSAMIPFVHMFYSSPSSYLWEDDSGVVRTIQQGEGGEQGDALIAWGNTQLSRRCSQGCFRMSVSLRIWTMCT